MHWELSYKYQLIVEQFASYKSYTKCAEVVKEEDNIIIAFFLDIPVMCGERAAKDDGNNILTFIIMYQQSFSLLLPIIFYYDDYG